MTKIPGWPDQPEEAFFKSGEDMWEHYNRGQRYNPFEGLHLSINENLQDKIDNKLFDRNDKYNDVLKRSRDYLMRVRIQDLFYQECDEYTYYHIQEEFNTIKEHNPSIPELDQIWCGTTEETMEPIIHKYIQLLDPYIMSWIDPEKAEYDKKEEKYLFHHEPPIGEFNTHFLYNTDIGEIEAIAEQIQEYMRNNLPWEIQEILCENEEYL